MSVCLRKIGFESHWSHLTFDTLHLRQLVPKLPTVKKKTHCIIDQPTLDLVMEN